MKDLLQQACHELEMPTMPAVCLLSYDADGSRWFAFYFLAKSIHERYKVIAVLL